MSSFMAIVTLVFCVVCGWEIGEAAEKRNLPGVIAWLSLLLIFLLV